MARELVENMQTPRKLCNTCVRALDVINSLLSENPGAGSQGPQIVTESLVLALRKKGYLNEPSLDNIRRVWKGWFGQTRT